MEGDPCKFALWVGRTPTSDNKIVLKVKLHVFYGYVSDEIVHLPLRASRKLTDLLMQGEMLGVDLTTHNNMAANLEGRGQ